MKKLWGGRFSGARDSFAEEFGASIHFDSRFAPHDIQGSIAHATMLGESGIIPLQEAQTITAGLERVREKLVRGEIDFKISDEDIHMNIERHLGLEIGEVAGKLHTARSRNDQVALDFHLFIREAIITVANELISLQQALLEQAEKNLGVIMPGYTHLQRAQPILFSHHMLAYVQMFARDHQRLQDLWKRVNVLPLGAGALAGTTFPIRRERVAELLKFDAVYENSMDAVSDRDFVLEFLSTSSIAMMHLSRLCEEIFLWSSGEFGFIELDDALSTGSSMMPQKKNPDFAELVRGKTGRVYGSLVSLLTTMKGLPLTYNKDMQEDKEGTFDTLDTLLGSLLVVTAMVKSWKVHGARMRSAAEQGFTNATDAADYLVTKGVAFRDAHEIVGKLVRHCIERGSALLDLTLEDYQRFSPVFQSDVFKALALETVVERRTARGGTASSSVQHQITVARSLVGQEATWCEQMSAKIGLS
jgi:argininosuccinate lyase